MIEEYTRPKFYMLMGLPGSGKTTIASQLYMNDPNAVLLSSDEFRNDICPGDYSKEAHGKVFSAMNSAARKAVKDGFTVVYDATNLSRKRRMGLRELMGNDHEKVCICVLKSVRDCIQQDRSRVQSVGADVIRRSLGSFCPPHICEGWNSIELVGATNTDEAVKNVLNWQGYVASTKTFNQKSKWHEHTLGEHMRLTEEYAVAEGCNDVVRLAARYHDVGKLFTQEMDDEGEAHYKYHANVGAYEFLLWKYSQAVLNLDNTDSRTWLDVANLIYCHKLPADWRRSPKASERAQKVLGEQTMDWLMALNHADILAHGEKAKEAILEK